MKTKLLAQRLGFDLRTLPEKKNDSSTDDPSLESPSKPTFVITLPETTYRRGRESLVRVH